jgi:hypothetical protein
MTPAQARNLARQCVNCRNLVPCREGNWRVVWDGINCDNFLSKEAISVGKTQEPNPVHDGGPVSSPD